MIRFSYSEIKRVEDYAGVELLGFLLSMQNAVKRNHGGICNVEQPRCPRNLESGLKRSKRCFGPEAEV